MTLSFASLLALIQGLTEFWPISSSGHLLVAQALADLPTHDPTLDTVLHGGSLAAVCLAFRREALSPAMLLWIALASLPALLVGGVLYFTGAASLVRTPAVVAWTNIIFAVILWLADRRPSHASHVSHASHASHALRPRHAIGIGLFQVCAFLPGASRSGTAYTAARLFKLPPLEAARIAMILGAPLLLAATGAGLLSIANQPDLPSLTILIAGGISFLVSLAAIHLFLRLAARWGSTPFVCYRLVFGFALLAWVMFDT